jgi:hypothetical protein
MAQFPYPPDQQTNYQVFIEGKLDCSWSDWLGELELEYTTLDGSIATVISGNFVDQAALRGVLIRLWDLNLKVIQVKKITMNQQNK